MRTHQILEQEIKSFLKSYWWIYSTLFVLVLLSKTPIIKNIALFIFYFSTPTYLYLIHTHKHKVSKPKEFIDAFIKTALKLWHFYFVLVLVFITIIFPSLILSIFITHFIHFQINKLIIMFIIALTSFGIVTLYDLGVIFMIINDISIYQGIKTATKELPQLFNRIKLILFTIACFSLLQFISYFILKNFIPNYGSDYPMILTFIFSSLTTTIQILLFLQIKKITSEHIVYEAETIE